MRSFFGAQSNANIWRKGLKIYNGLVCVYGVYGFVMDAEQRDLNHGIDIGFSAMNVMALDGNSDPLMDISTAMIDSFRLGALSQATQFGYEAFFKGLIAAATSLTLLTSEHNESKGRGP